MHACVTNLCTISTSGVAQHVAPTRHSCALLLQEVSLPPGLDSSTGAAVNLTAGTWLNPDDAVVSRLTQAAYINRCSPSQFGAMIYFCSFVMLCGLVLVNFVIGVIIDNFQNSSQGEDLPICKASVDQFVQVGACKSLQGFTLAPFT